MAPSPKTPLEMFYQWEAKMPERVFLRQPKALQWTEYSWGQVGDAARRVAAFLRAKQFAPGSRIAMWSSNSKDWVIVDLAIMMAGHVSVPLYPGQDVESGRYIFEHSESKLVFLGGFDQWQHADAAIPADIERIAMMGCKVPCAMSLDDILAATAPIADSPTCDPESLWTLVYTSGTTGNPKGVMHNHVTPGHVCPDLNQAFLNDEHSRFMSFLPMSHIAERVLIETNAIYAGATVSFSEGLATFAEEIRSVQPTFFFAVPRLWIKFKEGVDAKVPPAMQAHLGPEQRKAIARQLGLAEAKIIITGSAPCPKDVQQWFIDMGILLRDGYGMTENCIHGVGWIHNDSPKVGCIGKPFTDRIEVRLSDEDEILLRSKALMKGYYREPEKTAEVLRDGWYHTGDTGRFDEDGDLWITGRLSEVFKTTKGKFVRPAQLENRFGRCELLAQFCVFGHGLDQPVVAVTLSEVGRQRERAALAAELAALLDAINAELPPWERIAAIFVADKEWTIDSGLLTPTMKLKRKSIEKTFRERIEADLGKSPVVFE